MVRTGAWIEFEEDVLVEVEDEVEEAELEDVVDEDDDEEEDVEDLLVEVVVEEEEEELRER